MSGPHHVLALDTVGHAASFALGAVSVNGVAILRTHGLPPRRTVAELTQAIAEVVGEGGPSQLGAVVVVRGPGSFTGMRAGLSAAKALAEALALPMLGVSRLQVLAREARLRVSALYAGRGRLYLRDAEGIERLLDADEARQAAAGETVAVCEERLEQMFASVYRSSEPNAADALHLAAERIRAGAWDDAATLDALYLWREEQMFAVPS